MHVADADVRRHVLVPRDQRGRVCTRRRAGVVDRVRRVEIVDENRGSHRRGRARRVDHDHHDRTRRRYRVVDVDDIADRDTARALTECVGLRRRPVDRLRFRVDGRPPHTTEAVFPRVRDHAAVGRVVRHRLLRARVHRSAIVIDGADHRAGVGPLVVPALLRIAPVVGEQQQLVVALRVPLGAADRRAAVDLHRTGTVAVALLDRNCFREHAVLEPEQTHGGNGLRVHLGLDAARELECLFCLAQHFTDASTLRTPS